MNQLHFAYNGPIAISAYGPDDGIPDIRLTHDSKGASVGLALNTANARWVAAQLCAAADAYEQAERTTGVRGRVKDVGALQVGDHVAGYLVILDTRSGLREFAVWTSGLPSEVYEGDELHLVRTTDRDFWRLEGHKRGGRYGYHVRFDFSEILRLSTKSADELERGRMPMDSDGEQQSIPLFVAAGQPESACAA